MRMRAVGMGSWVGVLAACGDAGGAGADTGSTGAADGSGTSGPAVTSDGSSSGGDGSDGGSTTGGPIGEPSWPTLECDPLVPEYCGYPYPNNVFTVADDATPTGRRLAISAEMLPRANSGAAGVPDPFNGKDGFAVGGTILAHLPGATATGLPDPLHIGDSVTAQSPTILLDADTGELVGHFAELDVRADGDADRSLMLRPAVVLDYGHRYIVALRQIVDATGALVPASPAFAALRDGTPSDEPSVEARRDLYADIFARLDDAGIERDSLQLAWDFSVASREETNGRLLYMRDASLDLVGDAGPDYQILSVTEDVSADIFRRIEGEIEVPLFLDEPGPGGVMEVDAGGQPVQNGVAYYPFTIQIPYSAQTQPAASLTFGHGLFGNRSQAEAAQFGAFANQANFAIIALDWIGMSDEDPSIIGLALAANDLPALRTLPDRLQQGLLNFLLATRMMKTSIVDDPDLMFNGSAMIDADIAYYYGGSQGGIMGASYMALSTDVERGVLGVPGQPYNLLLERSVDFDPFFDIIAGSYVDGFDREILQALAQGIWERAAPSGFSRHISADPLPGTEAHDVLMMVSIGDHQVTTLGAHVMARSIGAVNVGPVNRSIWGLPEAEGPMTGPAMIEHDFGLPPEPLTNVPMTEGADPHGALAGVPTAVQTIEAFLVTGQVQSYCTGPCDPS